MSASRGTKRAGFTLLEVLIAIAIVALLSLMGYRALAALSESESRLATEAADGARSTFSLRGWKPICARRCRARRAAATSREPAWLAGVDSAGNGALAFSRAGPEFALDPGAPDSDSGIDCAMAASKCCIGPDTIGRGTASPTPSSTLGRAQFRLSYLTTTGRWVDTWPLAGEADCRGQSGWQ